MANKVRVVEMENPQYRIEVNFKAKHANDGSANDNSGSASMSLLFLLVLL